MRVQHDASWTEWRDGQELAATGEKLAATVHHIRWDVVATADVMEANGIASATMVPRTARTLRRLSAPWTIQMGLR